MEKRILIIGSPGSGKSTLAHHLHNVWHTFISYGYHQLD